MGIEMGLLLRPGGQVGGWGQGGQKKERRKRGVEGGDPWAQEGREEEGVGSRPRRVETPDSPRNRNQDRPDSHQAGNPVRNVVRPCCFLLVFRRTSWKHGEDRKQASNHHLLSF